MIGEVRVVDHVPTAFAALVATEIGEFAVGAGEGDLFRLALSGGPTARRCYEELAVVDDVPWELVDVYFGDERCVAADSPDANQQLARESLLDRVGIVAGVHPLSCDDPDGYGELLRAAGPLDLIHLGLGPDGHTASLFAGSEALESPGERLVVRSVDPNAHNPFERISLTLAAIDAARLAVFTVAGTEKRDSFAMVRAGEDVPAARVNAGRVVWLVDIEAAGE